MPWKETNGMKERVRFIASYLEKSGPFSWLCNRFGVSCKTGYKWVERYESKGVAGLQERSRAPLSHPQAVADGTVEKILRIRKKHPRWGPRKLRVVLQRHCPQLALPAASTIGEILRKNGLTRKRRRIRRSSPYGDRLGNYDRPNAVWCADFKGHFPIAWERCHPLTISDGFSRYLLACQALRRPLFQPTQKVFESTFLEFGLPDAIRTDNGAPFSTLAPGGLSRLAVWWIRLGIRPERILPGRPDQNGRHERMHSTLKSETVKPPRSSFRAQQRAFVTSVNYSFPSTTIRIPVTSCLDLQGRSRSGFCRRERNSDKRCEASFPLPESEARSGAGPDPPPLEKGGYLRYGLGRERSSWGNLASRFHCQGAVPSGFAVFRAFQPALAFFDCSKR